MTTMYYKFNYYAFLLKNIQRIICDIGYSYQLYGFMSRLKQERVGEQLPGCCVKQRGRYR